ncbi:hypothetical protein TYRP_011098 [Tyrophagus putrescentiae]|nr:hypothetical protein TYRP_011098 [Tyrophagus putrescentiae]
MYLEFGCTLVTAVSSSAEHQSDDHQPKPYSFGYEIADEEGNQQQRAEVGDAEGVVRGTYGILDRNGFARRVVYVADHNGFRVSVASNEPGTKSSAPSAAVFSVGTDAADGRHQHLSGSLMPNC